MTPESREALDVWLEWAGRYADAKDSLVPTAGVAERIAREPEDRIQENGFRDAFRQIEYDLRAISGNLSSLGSRYYFG